jgi:hypothetical protein
LHRLGQSACPAATSVGADIGIFTAERYFSAGDVVRCNDAVLPRPAPLPDPPRRMFGSASDVASQSGRTAAAASSEASWNSLSGLLPSGGRYSAAVSRMKGGGGGGGSNKKPSQRWTLFGRECPCAGRKAVAIDAAASAPRSPAMDARFSAQSAVDECIESAIFKAKPRDAEPGRVKMTVTPGRRAFPLPSNDVVLAAPNRGVAAAIGRRAGGFAFPAAGRFTTSGALVEEPPRASLEVFRPIDEDSVLLADPPSPPPPALPRGRDLAPRAPPPADEEAMSDASSELLDLESFAASSSFFPTATSQLLRPPAPVRRAGAERVHVRAERGQRGVERGHGRGRRVRRRQLLQRGVRVRRGRGVPLRRPAVGVFR